MMTNLNVALGLIGDAMNHLDHNDTVFGLLAEARELIEQELPAEPRDEPVCAECGSASIGCRQCNADYPPVNRSSEP